MKQLKCFTLKRLRPIKKTDLKLCAGHFQNDNFYFFTKRPRSLTFGNITGILKNSYVLTNEKNRPIGILKYDPVFFGNQHTGTMEFRFFDEELYTSPLGEKILYSYINNTFLESLVILNKLLIRVYSFDNLTIGLLNRLDVRLEAVLKKHVFKAGTYHDVLVYGITREDLPDRMKTGGSS